MSCGHSAGVFTLNLLIKHTCFFNILIGEFTPCPRRRVDPDTPWEIIVVDSTVTKANASPIASSAKGPAARLSRSNYDWLPTRSRMMYSSKPADAIRTQTHLAFSSRYCPLPAVFGVKAAAK